MKTEPESSLGVEIAVSRVPMTWNWGNDIKKYIVELTNSVNTIILGRKMTEDFISHRTDLVKNKPNSEEYPFAKQMVDYNKIVFTKTLNKSTWENTILAKGDIVDEVNKLKNQDGRKDIVVYGGAGFVSSLIKNNLIDEYHLFINPTAIGKGLEIFKDVDSKLSLKLVKSTEFDCGIVVNQYQP
ncbi:MAG TPA: dihydrofolate reductase family protein [Ignavibacteriaceae bacterium]|jgi:dihydrofolate reductase|nr:dihydrofolate reductase family protein [Ignavibacteriaceae bacterium]